MAISKNGHFLGAINDFKTEAYDVQGQVVEVEPSGLYATWDWRTVYLHYTGDAAQAADILLKMPNDPAAIRKIAKGLVALAAKLEGK